MNKRKRKKAATLIAAQLLLQSPPDTGDVELRDEFDLIAEGLAKRYGVRLYELPFTTSEIMAMVDDDE